MKSGKRKVRARASTGGTSTILRRTGGVRSIATPRLGRIVGRPGLLLIEGAEEPCAPFVETIAEAERELEFVKPLLDAIKERARDLPLPDTLMLEAGKLLRRARYLHAEVNSLFRGVAAAAPLTTVSDARGPGTARRRS